VKRAIIVELARKVGLLCNHTIIFLDHEWWMLKERNRAYFIDGRLQRKCRKDTKDGCHP